MNGPLEHVEGRLAALLQKLNSISEKKAALEDSEKNNKVRAHHMFSRIPNLQLFFMILKLKGSKVSSFRKWHFFFTLWVQF